MTARLASARALAAVLTVLLTSAAAQASAAQRYASPSGTAASVCAQATPCDLVTAINGIAGNMPQLGDEVIVASGTYGSPTAPLAAILDPPVGENIHGAAGAARPLIYLGSNYLELDESGTREQPGVDLRHRRRHGAE